MTIRTHDILGLNIAVTCLEQATQQVIRCALDSRNGYVCAANVHMCMESFDDPAFRNLVNESLLTVPDGRPLYWWMKSLGEKTANQVRGPDLFLSVCKEAEKQQVPIALYGGGEDTLNKLRMFLETGYPDLKIAKAISPPFRPLSEKEEKTTMEELNGSGARILFVGLGCPKQEKWMAAHKNTINSVMIGVGAAFDFHAGTTPVAPEWMRRSGLEWMHRLGHEPRRLWKRYLWNNPRFIFRYAQAKLSSLSGG